ncbi:MAG: glycosyltransferase [Desulfobacterales bacterium]|nr:glycosyltransferase [Desulfobacterales bacterium]
MGILRKHRITRRRKILFVSYYRFPCSHPVLENVFAKELGLEYEITFLLQGDLSHGRVRKWHNANVILAKAIKGKSIYVKAMNRLLALEKFFFLIYFLLCKNVNIVFIRDMPFQTILIAPLKFLLGFKLYYQHSAPLSDMDIGYFKASKGPLRLWYLFKGISNGLLVERAIKCADIVFPISSFHKNSLTKFVRSEKLIPLTMGVDHQWLKRRKKSIPSLDKIKQKHYVVCYFGNLGLIRQPKFILKLFAEVKKEIPQGKLLLIGDATTLVEIEELKSTSWLLGIDRDVIFTGNIDRNSLQDYLSYCDLTISAIPPEEYFKLSSPTKLYESLGNGIPVVGNREIFEQEKVIRESGGGTAVDYEVIPFAQAIIVLITKPNLRREMSEKGKNYVTQNYSYQNIARRISRYFSV